MVSGKVVVVLLVLAIVLSIVSLVITLNVNINLNKSSDRSMGGPQTGQVSLIILPPENVQNETENK